MTRTPVSFQAEVPDDHAGQRIDQVLAALFPDFSRARLQQWIKEGRVLVNGATCRPKDRIIGGERIALEAELEEQVECAPQPIPLNIVFEDEHLLVIDKPAGLVVHPAAGNPDGTLQNALLHHDMDQIELPRAGIIHRLDKDTSGLMVVARSSLAHRFLVEELQERNIHREYRALVWGVLTAGGTVDEPIGRHPTQRVRMAVVHDGKPAVTHYRVMERYRGHTLLQVNLETGRTHQIRVHMAHLKHPIVGDPVYGGRLKIPAGATPALMAAVRAFPRQALHAARLGLEHPETGEWMEWESELPEDFAGLLEVMEADASAR